MPLGNNRSYLKRFILPKYRAATPRRVRSTAQLCQGRSWLWPPMIVTHIFFCIEKKTLFDVKCNHWFPENCRSPHNFTISNISFRLFVYYNVSNKIRVLQIILIFYIFKFCFLWQLKFIHQTRIYINKDKNEHGTNDLELLFL